MINVTSKTGHERTFTNAAFEELFEPKNRGLISVYVLCADNHAVKIGLSQNPGKRCSQIQVGQDREICVYWAVQLWRPQAREIEKRLHARLQKQAAHIRGEWYLLSPAQAVAEIQREISLCGYENCPNPQYGIRVSPSLGPIPRQWHI